MPRVTKEPHISTRLPSYKPPPEVVFVVNPAEIKEAAAAEQSRGLQPSRQAKGAKKPASKKPKKPSKRRR